jgi:DNA-binding transcriptional ArsR family regulator
MQLNGSAAMAERDDPSDVARFADMLAALGTEPRLRIVRLLLAAYPEGVVAGDIAAELGIAGSTLSHHLEKLRNENLVTVRREGTFLRYAANAGALRALLAFLYAECCTRSCAVQPNEVVCNGRPPRIPDDHPLRRQGHRARKVR